MGHEIVVLAGGGASGDDGGVRVIRAFDPSRPSTIREVRVTLAREEFDEVLIQYNPFGYGPRGFNPWLAGTLRNWRNSTTGSRLSVLFHETYVPPESLRFLAMLTFQYPQFTALCRIADRIFVSTGRWAEQVRRVTRETPPIHLPVGSNLPGSDLAPADARAALRIPSGRLVLGVFGSAHVSRLLGWMTAALAACREREGGVMLLHVGDGGESFRSVCPAGVEWRSLGRLEAAGASDALAACDAMLSPFIDGLSTRRGSVMAALQVGLPVFSTSREWTDSILLGKEDIGIHLSPVAEGPEAFACLVAAGAGNGGDCGERRKRLAAFYLEHFDWPVLARRFIDAPGCIPSGRTAHK